MSDADRERWERKHAASHGSGEPSSFLLRVLHRLPTTGRAVDVAGGKGRNALRLAEHGLDVTLVDIAPSALAAASARASERDLPLTTMAFDLDAGLPPGPWDVLVMTNFLDRALFAALPQVIARGGWFVFLQPTRTNLERHPRPSARFLLAPEESATLLPSALEVVVLDESWGDDGRHEARVLARRR